MCFFFLRMFFFDIGTSLGHHWDIIGTSLGHHWDIIGTSVFFLVMDHTVETHILILLSKEFNPKTSVTAWKLGQKCLRTPFGIPSHLANRFWLLSSTHLSCLRGRQFLCLFSLPSILQPFFSQGLKR